MAKTKSDAKPVVTDEPLPADAEHIVVSDLGTDAPPLEPAPLPPVEKCNLCGEPGTVEEHAHKKPAPAAPLPPPAPVVRMIPEGHKSAPAWAKDKGLQPYIEQPARAAFVNNRPVTIQPPALVNPEHFFYAIAAKANAWTDDTFMPEEDFDKAIEAARHVRIG